jgi:D-glycero-D-manno-heptose 1,7-bisphosphate phosphatase
VHIISSAAEACRHLKAVGYVLVVVTNQPDIARGTETLEGVRVINEAVAREVPVDEFVICPHDDPDGCACRKPLPGMLQDAAARLRLNLDRSFMVGDRWRDIEAGKRAGCVTIFIDRGYTEKRPDSPDFVVNELAQAVPRIVAAYVQEEEGPQPNA